MRIVVLSAQVPSLYTGGAIRLLHLLRHLGARHEIILWTLDYQGEDLGDVAERLPGCRVEVHDPRPFFPRRPPAWLNRSHWYWRGNQIYSTFPLRLPPQAREVLFPEFQGSLDNLLASSGADLIHVHGLWMWPYVRPKQAAPVLLCTDDSWTTIYRRAYETAPPRKWTHRLWRRREMAQVRRLERLAVSSADRTVVVSETDRQRLLALAPGSRIDIVPNGVDTQYFAAVDGREQALNLVFTGTMSWEANSDGVAWFCREMLPLIGARIPDVRFKAVGINPPAHILALNRPPALEITGRVPDVRPYLAEAALFVVPLRIGGGTRLKILEALAAGKAVVSTSVGAEGLDLVDGRHLVLADTPREFADRVCELLQDPERRKLLGTQGRALVQERYDWRAMADRLDNVYHQVAGGRPEG